MVSVIIPAHNEEQVIARLLSGLVGADPGLEIVVVCNGCSDRTAELAASFPGVRVLETAIPSKHEALRLGASATSGYPRVHVDADVEISREALLNLAGALAASDALVAAPRRIIPRTGASALVRCYYDIWERLPQVQAGLFGRGVVALSEAGCERLSALPELMSDDLAASSAFDHAERLVVDSATVVVHPPRTWTDLIRRRVRACTGTAQAYAGAHSMRTDSRTSSRDLVQILRQGPTLFPKVLVFLAVTALARRRARRAVREGDFTTWLRDNSSREPV